MGAVNFKIILKHNIKYYFSYLLIFLSEMFSLEITKQENIQNNEDNLCINVYL